MQKEWSGVEILVLWVARLEINSFWGQAGRVGGVQRSAQGLRRPVLGAPLPDWDADEQSAPADLEGGYRLRPKSMMVDLTYFSFCFFVNVWCRSPVLSMMTVLHSMPNILLGE
jgi:hypothetical protein